MSEKPSRPYVTPEVTEYGSIESITEQSNKVGPEEDQYSQGTPIVGSVTTV